MRSILAAGCVLVLALTATFAAARSSTAAGIAPGDFDFYVLSLSWSPSYCKSAGPRANRRQCGSGQHYGFIVHGLWPQNAQGYPGSCRSPYPARVPQRLGAKYFDIMPSMALIGHEWRTHGTCSGLDQGSYFALVRKARKKIVVPNAFKPGSEARQTAPDTVEKAFIAANPGLPATGIAVTCNHAMVADVRICLTRSLDFRSCAAVDRESCPVKRVSLPGGG